MNIKEVEKIIISHINTTWNVNGKRINLGEMGVSWEWSRGKRVFGFAKRSPHMSISISKPLVMLNIERNPNQIIDTIKHEVAHLLDYVAFGGWGHGITWKACCRLTGANPKRCYSANNIIKPEYKYKLVCPACDYSIGRYRKPRSNNYVCGVCHKAGRGINGFKLVAL